MESGGGMIAPANGDLVEVRLVGVPIRLRERSTQHSDELLREMTLIAQEAASGHTDLPRRLLHLADEVRGTYSEFTVNADAEMDQAAAAGIEQIDVVYRVPPRVVPMCEHILEVIEEADAFCRQGRYLLTLASPPDIRAYQRWILGEFIRQPRGEPPLSWADYRASEGSTDAG